MLKLEDKIINTYLENEYNHYIQLLGKNSILGTFCIGLANYGFAENVDELKFITIYIPSFEELCLNHNICKNNSTKYGKLFDLREVYTALETYGNTPLELLFTNYFILNPKYEKLFNLYFYNNRENIAIYDKKQRLSIVEYNIREALNRDDMFEAARLSIAADLYAGSHSCEKCFHITDPIYIDYLWDCKNKNKIINSNSILTSIENIINNLPIEDNSFEINKIIKEGIVAIMYESLESGIDKDAFIACLTNTEKKAFHILETKLIDETVLISISKIIEETGISRPVWTSLLKKMANNKIAIVDNLGAKGTSVKLL